MLDNFISANVVTIIFSIINIAVWIGIIMIIIKNISKIKQVYGKINSMDKKIDCILNTKK